MLKAVIQAGGKGTRLRPYTTVLPKPLMPLDGAPVIEMLLKWLRRNGIDQFYITIGYLGHLIKSVIGDGSQWDMNIEYSQEPEPLGTVGPLCLLGRERLNETFLMLNGDLLTDLDLREFIKFHKSQGGMVTIAATRKNVQIDLGVLECSGSRLTTFREKPNQSYLVSMGIYCIEPEVLDIIPRNVPYGFDNLMHTMLDRGLSVAIYEHEGLWMDIGRIDDYIKAQELVDDDQKAFLKGAI